MLSPTRRHRLTCAAAALTPLSSMPCNAPPPRCARESRRLDDSKNKSVQRIASRVSHDPHASHSPHHAPRLRKNGRRSFRPALDSRSTFPPSPPTPHVPSSLHPLLLPPNPH